MLHDEGLQLLIVQLCVEVVANGLKIQSWHLREGQA
jgi:hypothetical protein